MPAWWRSMAVMAGGGLASQALLVLGSLAIVVLYSPAELGVAAGFVSVVSTAALVAALRYDMAIPLARTTRDAAEVLVVSLLLVAATSALFEVVAVAAGGPLVRWIGGPPGLADLRFLVGPAVFAGGAVTVLLQWATRQRAYRLLAGTRVSQAAAQVALQTALGAAGSGAPGLALGSLLGGAAGSLRLARRGRAETRGIGMRAGALRAVLARHRSFPLLSLPAALFTGLSVSLIPTLTAGLYGAAAAGLVVLAYRVLSLPLRVVGEAASRTYFGDTAEMARLAPAEISTRLRQTTAVLLLLGVLPTAALVALGPTLFSILGDSWAAAGEYARPLAVMLLVQFVVMPIHATFVVFERLGLQAALAALRLAATVVPLLAAHAAGASALQAMTALSAGATVAYLVTLLFAVRTAASAPAAPAEVSPSLG